MLGAMGYASDKGDVCQPFGCISVRRNHGPEVIFHIMKFNPYLTKGHRVTSLVPELPRLDRFCISP